MRYALVLASSIFLVTVMTFPTQAQSTFAVEGQAVKASGSINPPNPIEACNEAKRDAEQKAAQSGSIGLVRWERLSTDSDCRLQTQRAGSLGYYFIFTARGDFRK